MPSFNVTVPQKQLTLQDFASNPNVPASNITDFAPDKEVVAPVGNQASNVSQASYNAILSGATANDMVDKYQQIAMEGAQSGQSATATMLGNQQQAEQQTVNSQTLMSVLADPSVSDNQKQNSINLVYNTNSALYTKQNMLATKALSAPVNNTNVEEDNSRAVMGDVIARMSQQNQTAQKIYNAAMIQTNPDMTAKVSDVLSSLVNPFGKAILGTKVAQDVGLDPLSHLLHTPGATVDSIRQAILAQNPDNGDRAAFEQKVADAVNAHPGDLSWFNDNANSNYSTKRELLQNLLLPEGYTPDQSRADTLHTFMDIGGMIAPQVLGHVNALLDAKAAAKAAGADNAAAEAMKASYVPGTPPPGTGMAPIAPVELPKLVPLVESHPIYSPGTEEAVTSNATRAAVVAPVQPASVASTLKDTNPDMARGVFDSAVADVKGNIAKATSGTDRGSVIVDGFGPQTANFDGTVSAKVGDIDALQQSRDAQPADLVDFLQHDGLTQYAQAEKAGVRAWKVNNFRDAIAFDPRESMMGLSPLEAQPGTESITDTDQGFNLRGVYGPSNSGYSNGEAAIGLAQYALRNTGIPNEAITLLKRAGTQYVPTTLEAEQGVGNNGDYLIGINHQYKITPDDFYQSGAATNMKVKFNGIDKNILTSGQAGTLTGNLFNPSSLFDPTISLSASNASDKVKGMEKILLGEVHNFAQPWSKLPQNRQALLLDEIHKANAGSIAFNYTNLKASGVRDDEIDILKQFERVNSIYFGLSNELRSGELAKQGWKHFMGPQGTNYPVRPMGKVAGSEIKSVFDYNTNANKTLSPKEMDDLHAKGGSVAKLLYPIVTPAGQPITHVVVHNHPVDGYVKEFTKTSQVLAHRPGYYHVENKAPHFIMEQTLKDATKPITPDNVLVEKAVASAPDERWARLHADRMNATASDPTLKYHYRPDNKDGNFGGRPSSALDIMHAKGMSTFRHRGKLLEDATSPVTSLGNTHVMNPVESMVHQAVSISKRTVMGPIVAAMDARIASMSPEFLPKDEFGRPGIPNDLRLVRPQPGYGQTSPEKLADTISTVQYANKLRNGTLWNALDAGTKAGFNTVADMFGKGNMPMMEKAMRAGQNGLSTGKLKAVPYMAMLALHPIRQFIVQGVQMSMLAAKNPQWLATNGVPQLMYISLRQMGVPANHAVKGAFQWAFGKSDPDKVFQEFSRSGLASAIDGHNLTSGVLSSVASRMINQSGPFAPKNLFLSKPLQGVKNVAHVSRLIGFDAGEFVNSASSWLADRDLSARQGLDVHSDAVLDGIAGRAKVYTGSMNHAGDMDYNQSALAPLMQFAQMSHKIMLLMTTDRTISTSQKVRYAATMMLLFGLPGAVAYGKYINDILPTNADPNDKRDLKSDINNGVMGATLNHAITAATGTKEQSNWGDSLVPWNMYGTADLMKSIWTTGLGATLANTPALSLFGGRNPQAMKFMQDMARWTNLTHDYKTPTQFSQVATDFAKMASGFSASFKAMYALKYGQVISASGNVQDANVTSPEALMLFMGIGTQDAKVDSMVRQDLQQKQADLKQDVDAFYSQSKQQFQDVRRNGGDINYTMSVLSEANRVHGGDPIFARELNRKIEADIKNGDGSLFQPLLGASSLYKNDPDALRAMIDAASFKNEASRDALKKIATMNQDYADPPSE